MTKEDLYGICPTEILDEFFDSNVCIPKGENRHKQADVLHEWIEGAEIQQQFDETDVWHDRKETAIKQFVFRRYRIKPSDPIYEYKWRVGCMFGIDTVTEQFLTEQEVDGTPFLKIEETKRVRS